MDLAVDLGGVGLRAAGGAVTLDRVDQHVDRRSDLGGELVGRDPRSQLHDSGVALFFDLLRHRVWKRVGGGTFDRLEAEGANAVELRLGKPVEEVLEILLGLARESDHERRADRDVGNLGAPLGQPLEHLGLVGRALHRAQYLRAGMLERNVEVRQHQPLGHQRDDAVDVGVRVNVMKSHPRAQLAEFAGEVGHVGAHGFALPRPAGVLEVKAVGAGVLADHQQLLRSAGDQFLGLAQDRVRAAADEVAADRRDDAERAAMVAALGDFHIAVVTRGQFDVAAKVGLRNEVEIGVGDRRRGGVDRGDDGLILLRAGHREHLREARADDVGFVAHAAGDNHPAILGNRLADRLEALFLGRIEEAARIDQHDVGPGIVGRHLVPVGAQLGQDTFAVDQRLGAAERNHADARRSGEGGSHGKRAP